MSNRVDGSDWGSIKELSLTQDAAKELLIGWNLNADGPLGVLVKRIRACRKLQGLAHDFDLGHFDDAEIFLTRAESSLYEIFVNGQYRKAKLSDESRRDELDSAMKEICAVYGLLAKTLKPKLKDDSPDDDIMAVLKAMQHVVTDIRRPSDRKKKKEMAAADEVSDMFLGFSRDDILSLPQDALLEKISAPHPQRESLYRDEYADNEEHLRRNMTLLLDKITKELQKSKKLLEEVKESLPAAYKDRNLEEIHTFNDDFEDADVGMILSTAMELKLVDEDADEDDLIDEIDDLVDLIGQYFEKTASKYKATKININLMHDNLPTADFYEQASSRTSKAIIRGDTAVVVKSSRAGDYVDIVEVGVRSDGVFVWEELPPDDDDASVLDVGYELVWHPQSSGREDGSVLERVLSSKTPAGQRMISLTLKVGEDVFVIINPGQENVESTGNSPGFRMVKSKPLYMSKQTEGSQQHTNTTVVPFYRFVVQLKVLETLQASEATSATDKMVLYKEAFAESGEVLAQALQLDIESKDAGSSITEKLEYMPLLLYHSSNRLIREIFPTFHRIFKNKWNKVLEVENKYDPPHIAEVKQMLLHMFLAGPDDNHIAVVREDQLTEIEKMISAHTHHQYVRIHVERENLHVVFRQLKRLNSTSGVVLVSLHVLGTLSPLDLGMIIEATRLGSLRIFIVFFQQLLYMLQVIGRKKDVLIAQSLEGVQFTNKVVYEKKDIVGCAVTECEDAFFREPWELRLDTSVPAIEQMLYEGTKWQQWESRWRLEPIPANPSDAQRHVYGLLVGDVSIVQQYYETLQTAEAASRKRGNNQPPSLIIMDWLKHNADDIVENYLPLPESDDTLQTPIGAAGVNKPEIDMTSTPDKPTCVVVLYAHLLSDALRRHVASRVMILGYKVVFAVPIFNPRDKTISVEEYNKAALTLDAQVWSLEPSNEDITRLIDDRMSSCIKEMDVPPVDNVNKYKKQALLIYRSLRLLAGQKLTHARTLSLITRSVVSPAREKLLISEITNVMETSQISVAVLQDILRIIFTLALQYIEIESNSDLLGQLEADLKHKSLHEFLAVLCVQKCFRSAWCIEKEIPFDTFVSNSAMCQFLSQRHRVEAWIRTILLPDSVEPEHIVSSRFPPGDNSHSLSVLQFCVAGDEKRIVSDRPCFEAVERHSTVRQSDLYLQQCMQSNELNWPELSQEWRVFPFSLDFLFELLRVYHQPLKLLSCIGLSNLHNLFENVSASQYEDVIERIKNQVSFTLNSQMLTICTESSPQFAAFISVLKWTLLSNGHAGVDDLMFESRDIELLLERHIPIKIREDAEETIDFVIPIILQLDGPTDIIFKFVGLREYFVSMPEQHVKMLLDKELPLGAAVLEFIFNMQIRRQIAVSRMWDGAPNTMPHEAKGRFINHPFFSALVLWLEKGDAIPDGFENFIQLLTTSTFGFLLSKCTAHAQTEAVMKALDQRLDVLDDEDECSQFLSGVLSDTLTRNPNEGQLVHAVTMLMNGKLEHAVLSSNMVTGDRFLDSLMVSLETKSMDPLMQWYEMQSQISTLPVLTSPALCDLYLESFADERIVNYPNITGAALAEEITKHTRWISREGVDSILHAIKQSATAHIKNRFLMFLFWMLAPFQMMHHAPNSDELSLITEMANSKVIGLASIVKNNLASVSNYALYLVAPYFLDLSSLNNFNRLHGEKEVQEEPFVICQQAHEYLSAYVIRIPIRPLPPQVLDVFDLEQFILEPWLERHTNFDLKFDVTSGVDKGLIELNMTALLNLDRCDFMDFNDDPTLEPHTAIFVRSVVLSWFYAFGATRDRIARWIENSGCSVDVSFMDEGKVDDDTVTKATQHPLPSFIDVRFNRSRSAFHLFGLSPEEASYTLQYYLSFLEVLPVEVRTPVFHKHEFKPPSPSEMLQEIDSFDTDAGMRRYLPTPAYKTLHKTASYVFGDCVRHIINQVPETGDAENPNYDLTSVEVLFQPFVDALAVTFDERSDNVDGPKMVLEMISSLVEGPLENHEKDKLREAMFHRALMSRIGVSSYSTRVSGLQDMLLNAFKIKGHAVCHTSLMELEFCSHGFMVLDSLKGGLEGFEVSKFSFDDSGTALTYRNLEKVLPLEYASAPKVSDIIIDWPSYSAHKSLSPACAEEAHPEAIAVHNNKVIEFFQAAKTAQESEAGKQGVQSSDRKFIPVSATKKVSVVHCNEMLEVIPSQSYGMLRVKPGNLGFLVRGMQHEKANYPFNDEGALYFVQSESPVLRKWRLSPAQIEASFPDNGVAWETVASLPPLSTLLLDGLALKKSVDGTHWAGIVSAYDIPSQPDFRSKSVPLHEEFYPWNILDCANLLPFQLDSRVHDFLLFISRAVIAYSDCHPQHASRAMDEQEMSESKLIHIFRRIDQSKGGGNQVNARCYCDEFTKVVIEIMETMAAKPTRIDTVVKSLGQSLIATFQSNEAAAVEQLTYHLSRTMASTTQAQLKEVLTKTFKQEAFLGKDAVKSFKTFFYEMEATPDSTEGLHEEEDDYDDFGPETPSQSPSQGAAGEGNMSPRAQQARQRYSLKDIKHSSKSSFEGRIGFGDPLTPVGAVMAAVGKRPPVRIAYLDSVKHKNRYNMSQGKELGYLLHKHLFLINDAEQDGAMRAFENWLLDLLRSPLSEEWKQWFLAVCRNMVGQSPPITDSTTVTGTQLVASCLARACPDSRFQDIFTGACRLPEEIEPFVERKDGYGIFFCDSGTMNRMQEVGVKVEDIDFRQEFLSGTVSSDEYYLRILQKFTGFTCCVYIQGLPVVSDALLKWCAEYTERCPWRFIYFENTDSTWNFSENRDRCNYKFYTRPSLESWKYQTDFLHEVYSVQYNSRDQMVLPSDDPVLAMLNGCVDAEWATMIAKYFHNDAQWFQLGEAGQPRETDTLLVGIDKSWELSIRTRILQGGQLATLLISPPGAGKTYFMKTGVTAAAEEMELNVSRIDCSNDELVERALISVLEEHFPTGSIQEGILIADEFHMMTDDQKEELISWVIPRLNWMKVFFVGNRSTEVDHLLMKRIREYTGDSSCTVEGRLTVEKVLELFSAKLDNRKRRFLELWCRGCRGLFSDESISLRNIKDELMPIIMHKQFWKDPLQTLLISKNPSLGSLICEQFVDLVLDVFSRDMDDEQIRDAARDGSSAVRLLVLTVLSDTTNSISSYREFCNRMTASHEAHPILRLAAWVTYVFRSGGHSVPSLDVLRRLDMIDQVGFPLIRSEARYGPLISCDGFAARGDYSNLQWMADKIQHGHAINWERANMCWKTQYITSTKMFDHLLSVCPDPGKCLSAVEPANLCMMINSATSTSLAEKVVRFSPTKADEASYIVEDSPFFMSCWQILRNQPPRGKQPKYSSEELTDYGVNLAAVLNWASRFALHLLDVEDDRTGRSEFLQQLLAHTTTECLLRADECGDNMDMQRKQQQMAVEIWGNLFAPLLHIGVENNGVPYEAALLIAASQHPPHPEWPPFVRLLSEIVHKKGDAEMLEKIPPNHPFFRRFHQREADFVEPGEYHVPQEVLAGLLEMQTGTLSLEWQTHLLTRVPGLEVPDEYCNQKVMSKHFIKGLYALTSEAEIKLAYNKFRTEVLRVYNGIFKVTIGDSSNDSEIQERKKEDRQQYLTRFLRRVCPNPDLLKYYNVYSGTDGTDAPDAQLDKHKNPEGTQFDLGRDGCFRGMNLLVGLFTSTEDTDVPSTAVEASIPILQQKGFNVVVVSNEEQFIQQLGAASACWIISSYIFRSRFGSKLKTEALERRFVDACEKFHKTGRGIMLWADNGPFVYHANLVLKRLMKTELGGSTPGQKLLSAGAGSEKQTFDGKHLVTSGITQLYEGTTISYPLVGLGDLQVLATSSDGHPVICYADNQPRGKLATTRGRIMVDCGFTRLWVEFNEAGTSRYIANSTIWMLGIDNMLQPNVGRDPNDLTTEILKKNNTINVPTEIANSPLLSVTPSSLPQDK
jgi:hypothetical protein